MTLERVGSFMTAFFAGAALLMAMLGVYGVVSYSVRQRTVEIGTRMALGATSRGILALIVGDGLKMAAYGVVAGGVAGIAAAMYLRNVFEIGALGPAPFLYSTAIVATVALMATTSAGVARGAAVADGGDPEPAGVDVAGRAREGAGDRARPVGRTRTSGSGRSSPSSPARFAAPRPFRRRCRWRWRRCGNGPARRRSCCSKNPGPTNTGTGSGRSRRTASC